MSVQVNTYVMFGTLLPYMDGPSYDDCEPYLDDEKVNPKGNVTVLFDGMNGEYIAVGHVIAKTGDDQHFDDPITLPGFGTQTMEMSDWVRDALIDLDVPLPATGPSWLVVSHYR